jgi:hypothetical protein
MRRERECFPSLPVIASWTGLSETGVTRALDVLTGKEGALVKETRPGRYTSNLYRLREGVSSALPESVSTEHRESVPSKHSEPSRVSPQEAKGVFPDGEGVSSAYVMKAGTGYQSESRDGGADAWLLLARNAWQEAKGDPPRWFEGDLRKLVGPTRRSADVLVALRCCLADNVDQKPSIELLRTFCQNVGQWVAKSKAPKREDVYAGSDEQRRAKAALYGISI